MSKKMHVLFCKVRDVLDQDGLPLHDVGPILKTFQPLERAGKLASVPKPVVLPLSDKPLEPELQSPRRPAVPPPQPPMQSQSQSLMAKVPVGILYVLTSCSVPYTLCTSFHRAPTRTLHERACAEVPAVASLALQLEAAASVLLRSLTRRRDVWCD